jgi:putative salt-induced outer membrane protein YdiY
MKLSKIIVVAAGISAAFSPNILAQTSVVTVTNIVTVTNVVTKTEPVPKPADAPAAGQLAAPVKYPWHSTVTAGLTLTRGNSDSLLAAAKFFTDKKTPVNEFSLGADATYGSSSGTANNESYHGFGQWNHLFSDRGYGYLRGEGLHDGIADIKYRATLTAGLGYYFIKEASTTLAGEVGPGAVLERIGTEDNDFTTLRLAERFEHKFNENKARVWQNVELLPQVDKPSDYLVNAEIGVESALSKSLSLQVFLDDGYNSQPATGRKRNDAKLVSGITYNF